MVSLNSLFMSQKPKGSAHLFYIIWDLYKICLD